MNSSLSCVIVADSSHAVADRIAVQFKESGRKTITCITNKELERTVTDLSPDLIVTELRLADGPSLPTLERIKASTPCTGICVLTGHGSVSAAVQCSLIGVDAYIRKPASVRDIVERLINPIGTYELEVPTTPISLKRACWEYINRVTNEKGCITDAAKHLGIDRRSLRRMLAKYAPPN